MSSYPSEFFQYNVKMWKERSRALRSKARGSPMRFQAPLRTTQWTIAVFSIALACADESDPTPPQNPRDAGAADADVVSAEPPADAKSDVLDPALSIGKPCVAGAPSESRPGVRPVSFVARRPVARARERASSPQSNVA